MKPTMLRERRAIGKSILEKKKWLKDQLSGLFITKSLNLQAEECTFKPRVNIIIFMHLFLAQVGKKLKPGGKTIILYLLKRISKKLSRKKGKINTKQHGQGEKQRQRIFSPSTPPAKVEQLNAWPRREKMKTQGEKIKTQREK